MRLVYFTHSLKSCWNHGNAHFLRGVLRALARTGHERGGLRAGGRLEPGEPAGRPGRGRARPIRRRLSGAAFRRLPRRAGHGRGARRRGPGGRPRNGPTRPWSPRIGRRRRRGRAFRLLFHDTHHRAVSAPDTMRGLDLDGYDGVLAFGEALAEVWRGWGWGDRRWRSGTRPPDTTPLRPARPGGGDGARGRRLDRQLGRRRADGRARKPAPAPLPDRGPAPDRARRPLPGPGEAADRLGRRALRRLAGGTWTCRRCSRDTRADGARAEADSMSRRCPAFQRSACSRRWPAAFRSHRPGGTMPRACSGREPTIWSPADEAEMTRHPARIGRRRRSAAQPCRGRAGERSAAGTAAAHRAEELRAIAARLGAAGAEDRPAAPSAPPLDRQTAEVAP